MPKISEGQFALGSLLVMSVWIFVVLPFLYVVPTIENPRQTYHDERYQSAQAEPRGTGLSTVDADVQCNIRLLTELSFLDMPVIYGDGRRGIITIGKGADGERAFGDAFDAWGWLPVKSPAEPRNVP
jgi:hypothetical protein